MCLKPTKLPPVRYKLSEYESKALFEVTSTGQELLHQLRKPCVNFETGKLSPTRVIMIIYAYTSRSERSVLKLRP